MKNCMLLLALISSLVSFSQLNIDSLSHINYQTLHDANLNDVWGYVDELGNEYAIVGTTKGTSIVNVTDPSHPVEIYWLAGATSIWRDPCVYGDYAYITTEAQAGLAIIDLSPLPASTNLPTTIYTGPTNNPWQSAHTCFLDENGYAYIFGANRGNGGVIILDVHTNPMQPIEVGTVDDWYVHDGFVRNDTMYLAHISNGFFSLVDCSNKANPVLLGTRTTPNSFTHTIWPTESGAHVFTMDEVSGAFITAYSITDPSNITEVDRTQHSPNKGIIPHNVFVRGDYLISSYYSDGVTIHDVSHPDNMILVGEYDTYPAVQNTNFDGCWGVYPYLPSGIILASDITEGLFILAPHYHNASYLVGNVTDSTSNAPLSNVTVKITGNDQLENTNSFGNYATGIYGTGGYTVTYSKVGYYPKTFNLTLAEGLTTTQNVQLLAIPPYPFTIKVIESGTGTPIAAVKISLQTPLIAHAGITNGIGEEDLTLFYQEIYTLTVAKWGYETNCMDQLITQGSDTLVVSLAKAYYDDFSLDLGWVITDAALDGSWERGKPFGTSTHSAPSSDADADCNDKAYVTGNAPSLDPDSDDLDGGPTILTSPIMDLTSYSDPHLNYSHWFFCMHGNPPNDTLETIVSNGLTSVIVDKVGGDPSLFYAWHPQSIRLSDFIAITNSMQVRFKISDFNIGGNVTEAGIDYVYISNQSVLKTPESSSNQVFISPNPFSESLTLHHFPLGKEYLLTSLSGVSIDSGKITSSTQELDTRAIQPGYYLLIIENRVFKLVKAL